MITSDTYVTTTGSFATEVTHTYSEPVGRISDEQWERLQMTWRCESVLAHGKGNYKQRTFIHEHTLIMQLDEINYRAKKIAAEDAMDESDLNQLWKFKYRRTGNG